MKNINILISLLFLFFSSTATAVHLNGNMINNNDGTYEVHMMTDNDNATEFTGNAVSQSDGTLFITVAVEDKGSEIYMGVGKPNQDGTYNATLKNNTTGEIITGTLHK